MNEARLPNHFPWQLPRQVVDHLAGIGVVRSFPRNTVIIHEGEPGDSMYIVLSGRVRVFLADHDGKEVMLNEHGPGEHLGEMMLDRGPRSASVITVEPSRFSVVSRDEFEGYLATHPGAASALIGMLMGRVRALTRTVGSLALLDVSGRVARMLVEAAVEEDGRLMLPHKLTQLDIAKRVGASREMVSRILADLKRGGYIEQDGHRIIILRSPPQAW